MSILKAYLMMSRKYFPEMSRAMRHRWVRAKINSPGPKCRIGDGAAPMFVREYFK